MARQFDGIDDIINCGDSTDFEFATSDFTLFCWVYPDSTSEFNIIMSKWDGSNDREYQLFLLSSAGSEGQIRFNNTNTGSGGAQALTGDTQVSTGVYTAIGFHRSGTAGAIFINGSQDTDDSGTVHGTQYTGSAFLALGGRQNQGTTLPLEGKGAEFAIWNAQLTDNEMLALGKGVSPFAVRSSNNKLYAPIHGNNSPEQNYANNGTGTLTGTTKAQHPPVQILGEVYF